MNLVYIPTGKNPVETGIRMRAWISIRRIKGEKPLLLLLLFLIFTTPLAAQSTIDTVAIKSQLSAIYSRDQKTRTTGDSSHYVRQIDSENLVQIEALISRFGWPGKDFVGGMGNLAVFAVIQHAELPVQEKYLPILEQSVAAGQSRPSDFALLKDRVLMREGKKQIFGSQVVPSKTSGNMEFYPIEDEANVNQRRKQMGLPTIEQYAKYFGIDYKAPIK